MSPSGISDTQCINHCIDYTHEHRFKAAALISCRTCHLAYALPAVIWIFISCGRMGQRPSDQNDVAAAG